MKTNARLANPHRPADTAAIAAVIRHLRREGFKPRRTRAENRVIFTVSGNPLAEYTRPTGPTRRPCLP